MADAPTNNVQTQGQGVINASDCNGYVQSVPFVTGLENFVGITGMTVFIPGLSAYNDGGQGNFYWNASGVLNDGVNNIQPNGVSVGCWTRLPPILSGGTISGNLAITGTLGVTGLSTLGSLAVTGAAALEDGVTVTGTATATTFSGAFSGSGASLTSVPGNQLVGTATNDSASAGNVGEYIFATVGTGSAISLTTTVQTEITSVSLTAGDWDVWGVAEFTGGSSTTISSLLASIVPTSGSVPQQAPLFATFIGTGTTQFGTATPIAFAIPMGRVSLATTTNYYLNVNATFGTSTCSGYGGIFARRVR